MQVSIKKIYINENNREELKYNKTVLQPIHKINTSRKITHLHEIAVINQFPGYQIKEKDSPGEKNNLR